MGVRVVVLGFREYRPCDLRQAVRETGSEMRFGGEWRGAVRVRGYVGAPSQTPCVHSGLHSVHCQVIQIPWFL